MGTKPVSVTVLAIISIIVASLTLLSSCATPVIIAAQWSSAAPTAQLYHEPVFLTVAIINLLINIPLNILLLVSAIGSLRLRPWARRGMIIYAWCFIAHSILGTAVNLLFVMPRTSAAMIATMPPGAPNMRLLLILSQALGVCFVILFMAFPVCILYFFTRPHVIDAFNGIFPAEKTAFPVDYHTPPTSPDSFLPPDQHR